VVSSLPSAGQVTRRSFVSGQDIAAARAKAQLCFEAGKLPPDASDGKPKRQKVEKSRPLTAPFDGPSTSRAAKATEVLKPSYAAVTGAIKVAVVPEDYPKAVLSSENLSQLEDARLEEIGR